MPPWLTQVIFFGALGAIDCRFEDCTFDDVKADVPPEHALAGTG